MPSINKCGFSIRMKKLIGRAEDQEYQISQNIGRSRDESELAEWTRDLEAIIDIKLEIADAARAEADGTVSPKQQAVLDDVELAHKIQDHRKATIEKDGPRRPRKAMSTQGTYFALDPEWSLTKVSDCKNTDIKLGPTGEVVGDVLPAFHLRPYRW